MKTRTKIIAWGTAASAIGIAIGVDLAREEAKLGSRVDQEIASLANGQGVDKNHFELGKVVGVSAAIEGTLDNMGENFSDARRAAGAACLVAALNGAKTTDGIAAYVQGSQNSDPLGYPTALRACETAAANLRLVEFEYPTAIASE